MKAEAEAVARCRKKTRKQYSFEVRKDDPVALWLDRQPSKQGAIRKALEAYMEDEGRGR